MATGARLSCAIRDKAGAPVDPTTLIFRLRDPGGVLTVYQYGRDAQLVRDDTGTFHVHWDITKPGAHYWRYEASPNVEVAAESSFYYVRTSIF